MFMPCTVLILKMKSNLAGTWEEEVKWLVVYKAYFYSRIEEPVHTEVFHFKQRTKNPLSQLAIVNALW